MAKTLWGNVYYGKTFAGILNELPGGRVEFRYDKEYLTASGLPISFTLPLREEPYISESGLHPFFDNLVSEGWLQEAQSRAIGVDLNDRLALLLGFGQDCAGAVSVIDPEKTELEIDPSLKEIIAALQSRASLSGVQPKVFAVRDQKGFSAAKANEISTYIAKLPSKAHDDLIQLEWLTTKATRVLLPREPIAEMEIAGIPNVAEMALLVKRFDRTGDGLRIHFEEFNTLLGNKSKDKYSGSYEQMGQFIQREPACISVEAERLFRRILACFLLGNTDAHLKNFAMMHQEGGLRLSPAYDLVGSAVYKQYNQISLSVLGNDHLRLSDLAPKHLIGLATGFGLSEEVLMLAVEDFGKRLDPVKDSIENDGVASKPLKQELLSIVDKRWRTAFESIGTVLSKKRGGGEKLKGFRKRG